ncbi:MAG: bifunctional acetate--CoA ligase family protein/GNAT family N-acetyltransferase [Dehalococcoidales bacterium]|nr:bifunctional acetate--CoA ligase family protein/GNAT family N-acetyltransferase [Dehalococcoidales bacterium]
MDNIKAFFSPDSVVVVGASDKQGSVANAILKNLLAGKDKRKVFTVGTKGKAYDLPKFDNISLLPETPDLAVIVTRADTVPDIMEECAKIGIKSVIVISSGFKEVGDEGKAREDRVIKIARKNGMHILGPNCIGVIRPSSNLNATFSDRVPKPGYVTFLSQSGALGTAVLDWAVSQDIGFSSFVSLGSMVDLDFGDLIDYFGTDPETRSIIIYMESIGSELKNARKFMSAAKGFARNKPIIILKPGKFPESTAAAMSHTGAMVGVDAYYDAAFDRSGAIRVEEIKDLFNCAAILNTSYLPKDPRLAIVTNAGGPGVLATDALITLSGKLAKLNDKTIKDLNEAMPPSWSKSNPIDVLGDATPQRFAKAINIALQDQGVGGLLVIYVPTSITTASALAQELVKLKPTLNKPILTVMMGGADAAKARQYLYENGIPSYEFPEEAIQTYLYMYKYKGNLDLLYEAPEQLLMDIGAPKNYLKMMMRNALKSGRTLLNEEESKNLLTAYRINSTVPKPARTVEEAVALAQEMGYPVVMKINSPNISHKSDIGGVKLGLNNPEAVRKTFDDMVANVKKKQPNANITGVTIQKMITGYDYELIIGSKKDNVLGPVIMFGAGGTSAEFYKDIAVGLPPLNQTLARRLVEKTKIYKMLSEGFRNNLPVNLLTIDEVLVKISNIIIDFPEIKELDINPLVIKKDAIALDARVILDDKVINGEQYGHLIISPYPVKYIETWTTKDDKSLTLRPIRPEDEIMEKELLAGLSEETQRFRFFEPLKDITHEMLIRYCNIDYEREMAFVAEYNVGKKKRIVGVSRLIINADLQTAEYAVLVADDFTNLGLGLKLSDKIVGFAKEKNLKRVFAITLDDNKRMKALGRKLGFITKERQNNEIELVLEFD